MAPERCGMLAVLDLHFQNDRVISETQVITADTDHEKFYVDWTSIERPEGYSEVAGGVAYIRDEPPATWTPKKTEELQPTPGAYSYIWGNQVKGNLSWLLLVLILPEGRRLGKFKPIPIRMRAKVFKNRLVLIIWVSAETNYFEGTLELKKLKRELQFEAKLKNNLYLPKRPVIQDIIRDVIVPIHQTDVAILTVLPEEYEAVCSHLVDVMPPPLPHRANLYAWKIGVVKSNVGAYSVAVGMIGRAGTNNSTVATLHALDYWHPRYVFFVGIAGGLGNLSKGDVVVADIIYGYEYGKIERRFLPRSNWCSSPKSHPCHE